MNDTISSPDASPMFYVGSSDYYFAVPKSRPDLMNDINAAMTAINRVNPRYNDEVKSNYSTQNSGSSSLASSETAWLKAHGNSITVGYLTDLLPYCAQNADGEMEGSLASLLTTLRDKFGIKVKTTVFTDHKKMSEALSKGKIDVALPIYRDYYLAEQCGFIQSNSLGTVPLVALHVGGDLNENLKKIACTTSSFVSYRELQTLYPSSTITSYPSKEAVIDALNKGEATCAIVPSSRLETVRDLYDIDELKTSELPYTAELSCWMRRGNPELLGIINKGIINAGESLSVSSYSSSYSTQESDMFRFIYRNRSAIATVIIGMLLTFIAILIWALKRAQTEENKALAANAAKTAFLTRMSHDIRTPLNGILGLIEIEELKEGNMQVARESRGKATRCRQSPAFAHQRSSRDGQDRRAESNART